MEFKMKERYDFGDLIRVLKILRAPGGCPWDMAQNHHSIRQNFIEETYEVIEAIDNEDKELLKEELGDVMLQVFFHAEIESENNSFDINDVTDNVCRKLIIRHPHVFADKSAENVEEALDNWNAVKMKTKAQKTQTDVLNSVSKALPSLMRSQKLQQKAAKVGFDWESVDGALDKLKEEVAELEEAISENDSSHMQEELGDVLFSAVNIARFINADAENVLYNACEKFISRFSKMEQIARENNIVMDGASLETLDGLWEQAKK